LFNSDIVVVCDEKKRGPEGCRIAPDLIVEILFPSNNAIQMQRKFNLHLRSGVREYWVVNSENNGLTVYNSKNKSVDIYKNKDTVPIATLSGLNVVLEQVFAE
jgi:Uma2 family endonuclease